MPNTAFFLSVLLFSFETHFKCKTTTYGHFKLGHIWKFPHMFAYLHRALKFFTVTHTKAYCVLKTTQPKRSDKMKREPITYRYKQKTKSPEKSPNVYSFMFKSIVLTSPHLSRLFLRKLGLIDKEKKKPDGKRK